jgi:hypothetical protein
MNPQLTGAAGVFYVASELSMRGLVALPSIRNVKGADILVADPEGKQFALLQVKTSKSKVTFWPIGESARQWTGNDCFYVFVRRAHGGFEAFLERASVVAYEAVAANTLALSRGCKKWALAWAMTGIYASKGAEDRTRHQWETFALGPKDEKGRAGR